MLLGNSVANVCVCLLREFGLYMWLSSCNYVELNWMEASVFFSVIKLLICSVADYFNHFHLTDNDLVSVFRIRRFSLYICVHLSLCHCVWSWSVCISVCVWSVRVCVIQ